VRPKPQLYHNPLLERLKDLLIIKEAERLIKEAERLIKEAERLIIEAERLIIEAERLHLSEILVVKNNTICTVQSIPAQWLPIKNSLFN
jgi:hypothetical protein